MARNVNIWVTEITATGKDIPVPQYEVELRAEWQTNAGEPRERM